MYKAKKYFCLALSVIFVVSLIHFSVSARTITVKEYINSDFDDGSWGVWAESGSEAPQITSVADKTPGQSVLMSHQLTSAADSSTISATFDPNVAPLPSGKIVFEANIKLIDHQTDSSKYTERYLFNISGGTNSPQAFSLIKVSGSASGSYIRDYTGSNALLKYAQNTWYHLKVIVDFATVNQPVQYYINDTLITKTTGGGNLPTLLSKSNLSDFKVIKLFSSPNANDTSETYIDDIKVYQIQDVNYDPLDLKGSVPQNGAANVSEDAAIGLTFNNPLKDNMFNTEHMTVTGGAASITSITPTAGNAGCTIKFAQSLDFNTVYTVNIQNVQDIYNQTLNKSFSFTTRQGYLKPVLYNFYKDNVSESNKITQSGLASGNIYSTVNLTNYGAQDSAATLVMGLYNGNTMEDITSSPLQVIKSGESKPASANLQVALSEGDSAGTYYIKLFIWDSIYGVRPVYNQLIFNRQGIQK